MRQPCTRCVQLALQAAARRSPFADYRLTAVLRPPLERDEGSTRLPHAINGMPRRYGPPETRRDRRAGLTVMRSGLTLWRAARGLKQ
jgi:hypothetical protein